MGGRGLAAGLHGRCRWRCRSWLAASSSAPLSNGGQLAAGRRREHRVQRLLLFIAARGTPRPTACHPSAVAAVRRLPLRRPRSLGLDDTPTSRYGPKVQGAGHPPQSHARPGRRQIPLRAHLGQPWPGSCDIRCGARSPAPCGRRSTSGRKISPSCPRTRLEVSDETRTRARR